MTLFSIAGATVQYGANILLTDINLTVAAGDRWGIIGRNGSGKTSLFRMVTGALLPTKGSVMRAPQLRWAELDQHRAFPGATTVWEAASGPFAELLELEHSLQAQAHAMGERGDALTEAELTRYDHDLETFQRADGYGIHARIAAVLHGLGFDPDRAVTQQLATLSGGERGRLGLACQLVAPTDLLLLDEPTNHLDLETTEWLIGHLRGLEAGLLIISHDRAFLDEVADHMLHLEGGTGYTYTGGYTAFVAQRTERRLSTQRAFDKQAKVIAAQEDYIRRNIAGQDTKQAKGRRRILQRMPRLSPPPGTSGAMALRFQPPERGGDQVLVADNVSVGVEGRVLLAGFSASMRRGDVVGLVGPNGAGKTTLLASLLGQRHTEGGEVRVGQSTTIASYRQDLAQVPREKTLFDTIHDLRPQWTRGQVYDHLGRFDFSGDEVLRRSGSLSGGELARVALAIMTLEKANLLVFDEPTNHLDVESIEALEDALEGYEGTVLLVSHDRALLRGLCTRVWRLEDSRLRDFDGSFAEWETVQAEEKARVLAAARQVVKGQREKARAGEKESQGDRKARQSAQRTARRTVETTEARVHQLDAEVTTLHAALEDPALYAAADGATVAAKHSARLKMARVELDQAYAEWTRATEALDKLGP